MWNRAELKGRAKAVLKSAYWKSLLVSVIIGFFGGASGGSSTSLGSSNSARNDVFNPDAVYYFLLVFGVIILVAIILAIAFRIFLGYPLEVGGRRFFIESARGNADLNYLGYGFTKEKYMNIVGTMFLRGLYNFFWYLLFFIPGIIKHYAYSMVPYILAENPQMESDKAIKLSMDMTKGQKLDIWVLDLSFIGWYILGTLAFFVGTIFVMPYENATKAELYLELRREAIDTGLCSADDLSSL